MFFLVKGRCFLPHLRILKNEAMNIGFDAKRAFHNQTGLGHYSRTLIHSLAKYYPVHEYYLFNPKRSVLFSFEEKNVHEIVPGGFPSVMFPAAWRGKWVTKDLERLHVDLYHGLSHEIPLGVQKTNTKSVVTIHDLIHERYPQQYSPVDVRIYRKKFRYACEHADKVIAISQQTRKDIIDFYGTPPEKIVVSYQSCNPAFAVRVADSEREAIRLKYDLPNRFFLYVGSIIERKNLMNVCRALFILRQELKIPLVVIGDGGRYKQQVKDLIRQSGLEGRVIFLSESPVAKLSKTFQNAADLPAIYQSAIALIYPSFFEGFGIPVLEALCSRLPVVTSNVSSLPEVGGDAACYVDPRSAEEIADRMQAICRDQTFADRLKGKGVQQAQKFTQAACAETVMNIYRDVASNGES